jgi:hypothetical protein
MLGPALFLRMCNQNGLYRTEVLDRDCRFLSGIAVAAFCVFREQK